MQQVLPLKKFICFLFCLLAMAGKSEAQQDIFELSIHSSDQKEIRENIATELRDSTLFFKLRFKRKEKVKKRYCVYVMHYNEAKEISELVFPARDAATHYSIGYEDSVVSIDLFGWYLKQQEPGNMSVIITESPLDAFSLLEIDPDRPLNRRVENDAKARFNSITRFLKSGIPSLPREDELENIVAIKNNNLQPVEADLRLIYGLRSAGLVSAKTIRLSSTATGDRENKAPQFIYTTVPPGNGMLLKWAAARNIIAQDSLLNSPFFTEMITSAAEKHVQLVQSRGFTSREPTNFNFSLREVVQTLMQWEKNKVGLLLYSLKNDGLSILYADNHEKVDTAFFKLTKEQLFTLEGQLKLALQQKTVSNKNNSARGNKLLHSKKSPGLDSLVSIISNILLPQKFELHLLDHLVIVPTLNVAAFPYAMLKLRDTMLLIDKMSYSIVPSINEFIINGNIQNSAKKHETYSSKIKMLGDSIYWSFDKPVLFAGYPEADLPARYSFDKLPGTKFEILQLSNKVKKPLVFLGADATKANIVPQLSEANIIYFATHAIADSIDPLNKSFILLSGKDSNAMLTAKEIQQSYLNAVLVVLSACETGLGKAHEGGMIGLARAFELAGAKNVLMSLWQISDSKTPQLMSYFFDAMANDGNGQLFFPHDALRKAVLKFKKENPDPLYWAAFSIFGVPL